MELFAMRPVPAHLDEAAALAHELGRDWSIGYAVAHSPEGILVRIEYQAYGDATLRRVRERFDDTAVRQIEHRDVDRIPRHGAVDRFEGRVAYGALGQELRRQRAAGIRREQARRTPVGLPAREFRHGQLAFKEVRDERAVDLEGDVRMRAARI